MTGNDVRRISICIPTYNRGQLLAEALGSIAFGAQNCEAAGDIEIVVSDNASTDATPQVVKRFQQDISFPFHIIYHRNTDNIGAIRNLINATALATGSFVWLFSDDDAFTKGSIRNVIALLNTHPELDYVFVARQLATEDLVPHEGEIEPKIKEEVLLLPSGLDLYQVDSGRMPHILGFFSSSVMRTRIWCDSVRAINVSGITEWSHLRAILLGIRDRPCAIVESTPVICRLDNARAFAQHSKVWLDDYVDTFLYARALGYDKNLCDQMISTTIRGTARMLLSDKARGLRSDNVFTLLRIRGLPWNRAYLSIWGILSVLPSPMLRPFWRIYLYVKRARRSVHNWAA